MQMNGLLHAPTALPTGKVPSVPTQYEAQRTSEPVWAVWRRYKSLTIPGIRT